jgi:hypothetical protein
MSSSFGNPFNPTDRMLRQFSVIWIGFFGTAALQQQFYHDRHLAAVVLATLAVTVGPLGIIVPRAIRPVFVGWMAIAYPIGWLTSRIIVGIIFYGLFTPVAFLFRIIRRDELGLRSKPQADTYWQPKQNARDQADYLRQF